MDATACETSCSACIELVVIDDELKPSDIMTFGKLYEIKENIYRQQYLELRNTLYFQEGGDSRYMAILKTGTAVVPEEDKVVALTDLSVASLAGTEQETFDGGIIFGSETTSLTFSQPIKIRFPVNAEDGTIIPVYAKHHGDTQFTT